MTFCWKKLAFLPQVLIKKGKIYDNFTEQIFPLDAISVTCSLHSVTIIVSRGNIWELSCIVTYI